MKPNHVHELEWDQAIVIARQACARVFRDGGSPSDAFATFGLSKEHSGAKSPGDVDWSKAVEDIAHALCCRRQKSAA